MPYKPGAFLTTNVKPLAFVPGKYDFTDFANYELGELDLIGGEMDVLLPDLISMASDFSDPLDDLDIGFALSELVFQTTVPLIPEWLDLPAAINETDALFAGAVASSPAEAWTDPPAPFIPPQGPPTITAPQVPLTAFQPGAANLTGIPITTPAAPGTGISLINATVYGSPNFRATDEWLIQATGAVGAAVKVHAWVNLGDIGEETLGFIGSDGRFEQAGNFSPGDVGAWREVWSIGGVAVADYNFLVAA